MQRLHWAVTLQWQQEPLGGYNLKAQVRGRQQGGVGKLRLIFNVEVGLFSFSR